MLAANELTVFARLMTCCTAFAPLWRNVVALIQWIIQKLIFSLRSIISQAAIPAVITKNKARAKRDLVDAINLCPPPLPLV
jgi:hypothetical protein